MAKESWKTYAGTVKYTGRGDTVTAGRVGKGEKKGKGEEEEEKEGEREKKEGEGERGNRHGERAK